MSSPIPTGRDLEIKSDRRRRWFVGGATLALAIMAGTLSLIAFAYIEQSDKVEALETQNREILDDHHAIGKAFTEQTKKLASQIAKASRPWFVPRTGRAMQRVGKRLSCRGRSGRSLATRPRGWRSRAGFRPLSVRRHASRPTWTATRVRWPGLALFASRTDPLSVWTRQALGGTQSRTLGPHRVRRLVGPSGVIYAWRKDDATYALIALPRLEPVGETLVSSMK